jgi:bifunctional non-homologous end joining protein LigD
LFDRLVRIEQRVSPFANLKKAAGSIKGARWAKPELVGQIAFTEWTRDGQLRHPSFLGLREDKSADEVFYDRLHHNERQ